MGILEFLTLVLIFVKLNNFGNAGEMGWVVVFIPTILACFIYLFIGVTGTIVNHIERKRWFNEK